ncbi:MAG: hypothetical protein C4583_13925 [Anaerolineaceae bacterium]|nr:MAG: hypothetical protein C4583_13925 [Anaerolineaceae bacterium]
MNNTSPIYQEFAARLQQRNLEAEIRIHRLLNEASPVHYQSRDWVSHRIAHFAEWMIVTGEALRQRYNHAAMHNRNTQTGALAR